MPHAHVLLSQVLGAVGSQCQVPGGTDTGPKTRLDTTVQKLFSAGVANSTQKSYKSGSKQFSAFYHTFDISPAYPDIVPLCGLSVQ